MHMYKDKTKNHIHSSEDSAYNKSVSYICVHIFIHIIEYIIIWKAWCENI